MLLALDERLLPYEIIGLGFERHRKPNARFERIGFRVELVIGEYQSRLDAHHIERLKAHGLQAIFLARLPHRIEYCQRILGMTEIS